MVGGGEGERRELNQLDCVGNWHKKFFRKWFYGTVPYLKVQKLC